MFIYLSMCISRYVCSENLFDQKYNIFIILILLSCLESVYFHDFKRYLRYLLYFEKSKLAQIPLESAHIQTFKTYFIAIEKLLDKAKKFF